MLPASKVLYFCDNMSLNYKDMNKMANLFAKLLT